MNKFDNYVFMSICDITFSRYNQTLYTSYSSYCKGMFRSIMNGKLSNTEKRHLTAIFKELEVVYSFTQEESNEYVIKYFSSNRCGDFEKVARGTNILFPFVGD